MADAEVVPKRGLPVLAAAAIVVAAGVAPRTVAVAALALGIAAGISGCVSLVNHQQAPIAIRSTAEGTEVAVCADIDVSRILVESDNGDGEYHTILDGRATREVSLQAPAILDATAVFEEFDGAAAGRVEAPGGASVILYSSTNMVGAFEVPADFHDDGRWLLTTSERADRPCELKER